MMGDRKGRPYAASSRSSSGRGDAIAPKGRAVAHAGFPMVSFGLVRDATRAWDGSSWEGNEAVSDSGWATARVAPTRVSSPSCSGCGGDACRRPRLSSHAGFPMVSFGSARDAARAWDGSSWEGNEAVPDSGWATARVAPTRPRRGAVRVGATLSRPKGAPSPMPVLRWLRLGRHGTPQGRGTAPRGKETKRCRIRDGRPRGSPLRGLVAEQFG